MRSEPILLVVILAVLTEAGGAVTAFASNMTTAGALIAAGAFLTGVGGAVARALVVPTVKLRGSRKPAAKSTVSESTHF